MGRRPFCLILAAFPLLAIEAPAGPPIADDEPPAAKPAARASASADAPQKEDEPPEGRLGMTRAILCVKVDGYEDYLERPDGCLTADEKLVIYYRPRHFATHRVKDGLEAHLIQDARIRRRGAKSHLQSKDKILDYKARGRGPIGNIYLTNTISVSELKPGDYDLDITLHDAVSKGPAVKQVLHFTIVPETAPREP